MYDRYRGEDWDRLKRSASEERMEQVREIDGEQAYEKMRRAMEKADQEKARQAERARQVERSSKLPVLKRPERRGPERSGPERDFGPAAEGICWKGFWVWLKGVGELNFAQSPGFGKRGESMFKAKNTRRT